MLLSKLDDRLRAVFLFGPNPDQAGRDITAGVGRFEMYRTVVIVAIIITAKKTPASAEKTKPVLTEAPPLNSPERRITGLTFQRVNAFS